MSGDRYDLHVFDASEFGPGVKQVYLVDSFEPTKHDLPKLVLDVTNAVVKNRQGSQGEL